MAETGVCEHGVSWVELTIIYGIRKPAPVPDDLVQKQKPAQIHEKSGSFTRIVRNFSAAARKFLRRVQEDGHREKDGRQERCMAQG